MLSGLALGVAHPGLKPWAMICSRFAAKSTASPGVQQLGYDLLALRSNTTDRRGAKPPINLFLCGVEPLRGLIAIANKLRDK